MQGWTWKPPPKPDLRDKVPLEEEEEEEEEEARGGAESWNSNLGSVSIRRQSPPLGNKNSLDGDGIPQDALHIYEEMPLRHIRDVVLDNFSASFQDSFKAHIKTEEGDDSDELHPPKNFAMVYRGVYRSAYPTKKNFAFLQKLGLKSVVYLCQEEYSGQVMQFYDACKVTVYSHGVSGNKEPFVDISDEMIMTALQRLLDVRYHPVLIHCNQGKHRTGSLVGCLRAMNHWSMTAIFDEYRRFAGSKARRADQQFIELFHRKFPMVPTDPKYHPEWFLG